MFVRKFELAKPLEETNLGVAQTLFNPWIPFKNGRDHVFHHFSRATVKDTLTAKNGHWHFMPNTLSETLILYFHPK